MNSSPAKSVAWEPDTEEGRGAFSRITWKIESVLLSSPGDSTLARYQLYLLVRRSPELLVHLLPSRDLSPGLRGGQPAS